MTLGMHNSTIGSAHCLVEDNILDKFEEDPSTGLYSGHKLSDL
jgi:hypothetical protein